MDRYFECPGETVLPASSNARGQERIPFDPNSEQTVVHTNISLHSSLGEGKFLSDRTNTDREEEWFKRSFVSVLFPICIQRAIELIAVKRTRDTVSKGMNLVVERLRTGGITYVLEGIRQDRKAAF